MNGGAKWRNWGSLGQIWVTHNHMIMYVGLFGHSAVGFHVSMFSCFCVLLTLCVVVFFQ